MVIKGFLGLMLFVSLIFSNTPDVKNYFINIYFNDAGGKAPEFIEIANETGTDYVRFNISGSFIGYAGKNTSYNIITSYVNGKDLCLLQSAYVNDIKIELFSTFGRVDNIKIGDNSYDIRYSFDEFESVRSGVKIFSYKKGIKGNGELKNDFREIVPFIVSYNKM